MDKILPWIGGIFAGVGLILVFYDVITTIKRHDKTKTNVVGLVLLSIGVVGYVITDLILPAAMPDGSGWPALASLVWILLFWVYVILDAITTLGDIKVAHRKKKQRRAQSLLLPSESADDGVAQDAPAATEQSEVLAEEQTANENENQ